MRYATLVVKCNSALGNLRWVSCESGSMRLQLKLLTRSDRDLFLISSEYLKFVTLRAFKFFNKSEKAVSILVNNSIKQPPPDSVRVRLAIDFGIIYHYLMCAFKVPAMCIGAPWQKCHLNYFTISSLGSEFAETSHDLGFSLDIWISHFDTLNCRCDKLKHISWILMGQRIYA